MFSLVLLLPQHNLSSPFHLPFFPYPYRKEGERDVRRLVDPLLFAPGSHKPPFFRENEAGDVRFIFFKVPSVSRLMWLKVITSVFCPCFWCQSIFIAVALRQASLFFIGSGLWASRAARYNDRYTTEEADSDPINLKQPLMLDPCFSLRSTPHAYKRTHLHALVLTSLKASVLVETCPVESIV